MGVFDSSRKYLCKCPYCSLETERTYEVEFKDDLPMVSCYSPQCMALSALYWLNKQGTDAAYGMVWKSSFEDPGKCDLIVGEEDFMAMHGYLRELNDLMWSTGCRSIKELKEKIGGKVVEGK